MLACRIIHQDHPFHVTSRLIAVNLAPTFDRFQLISCEIVGPFAYESQLVTTSVKSEVTVTARTAFYHSASDLSVVFSNISPPFWIWNFDQEAGSGTNNRICTINYEGTDSHHWQKDSYVFVTVRGWGQQDVAFRCLLEADKALVRATSVTYKEAWELPPSKRGGESNESKQIVLDPSIPVTPSHGSVSGDSTPTEHDYKELMDLADRLGIVVVDHNPPGKWGVLTLKGGEMLYIAIIVFMFRALHFLCMHHTTSCMPLLVIMMAYIRHCCSFVYRFVPVYSTL